MEITAEGHTLITTIITTYHRPKLLKRAVESVLKQTYPNFQVWVCDNGSDIETVEIMQEFEKLDSRVKYHRHPKNIGMMANYEFGLSRVNTPYFSILSDDDYLLPDFYEVTLQGFEVSNDAIFSACGVNIINENNQLIRNSLDFWEKEGIYNSPEGLLEMVETNGKFLYPMGLLFQNRYVKKFNIDSRNPLRWDIDWILQMIVSHSFVITKRASCVFFSNSEGFSLSQQIAMRTSSEGVKDFVQSSHLIIDRLMENPLLTNSIKDSIKTSLIRMLRQEITPYIVNQIKNFNFLEACKSFKVFKDYYNFNSQLFLLFWKVCYEIFNPFKISKFMVRKFIKKMDTCRFNKLT